MAGASGRLLATSTTRAASSPRAIAAWMAIRFVPRPETSTPSGSGDGLIARVPGRPNAAARRLASHLEQVLVRAGVHAERVVAGEAGVAQRLGGQPHRPAQPLQAQVHQRD